MSDDVDGMLLLVVMIRSTANQTKILFTLASENFYDGFLSLSYHRLLKENFLRNHASREISGDEQDTDSEINDDYFDNNCMKTNELSDLTKYIFLFVLSRDKTSHKEIIISLSLSLSLSKILPLQSIITTTCGENFLP